MSKLLLDDAYYTCPDEDGRVWLCDPLSGRWIPRDHAIWLRDILDRYIEEFAQDEIDINRYEELEMRRQRTYQPKIKVDESGYVYILQSEHGYKIGHTKRLSNRMSHFGLKLPFKIKLWGVIPHDQPKALEKEYHEEFQPTLINGEWFDLGEEELQFIMDADDFEKRDEELN